MGAHLTRSEAERALGGGAIAARDGGGEALWRPEMEELQRALEARARGTACCRPESDEEITTPAGVGRGNHDAGRSRTS